MPSSTLTGHLATMISRLSVDDPPGATLRPLLTTDRAALARLYLDSYPPGVAGADLAEARADVDATLNGDYGDIWSAASLVALNDETLVGSIQVVRRSVWDGDPEGPFIIELFVSPGARNRGLATALLLQCAKVCLAEGETQIALRSGEGTSSPAQRLYRRAGMDTA